MNMSHISYSIQKMRLSSTHQSFSNLTCIPKSASYWLVSAQRIWLACVKAAESLSRWFDVCCCCAVVMVVVVVVVVGLFSHAHHPSLQSRNMFGRMASTSRTACSQLRLRNCPFRNRSFICDAALGYWIGTDWIGMDWNGLEWIWSSMSGYNLMSLAINKLQLVFCAPPDFFHLCSPRPRLQQQKWQQQQIPSTLLTNGKKYWKLFVKTHIFQDSLIPLDCPTIDLENKHKKKKKKKLGVWKRLTK